MQQPERKLPIFLPVTIMILAALAVTLAYNTGDSHGARRVTEQQRADKAAAEAKEQARKDEALADRDEYPEGGPPAPAYPKPEFRDITVPVVSSTVVVPVHHSTVVVPVTSATLTVPVYNRTEVVEQVTTTLTVPAPQK